MQDLPRYRPSLCLPETEVLMRATNKSRVAEVPSELLDAVRTAVEDAMTNVVTLKVPLIVESGDGDTWDAAH